MGNTEAVAVESSESKNNSYQEIINSKSFFKKIVENMADGVSIVDNDGMHIDVNAAFCKMVGYSKQELIGSKPPHLYWPKEEYESIQQAFQKTMHGEVKDFSLIFKRKNGERFPVIVSPSLVKDSSGEIVCYYATVKDISQFQKIKDDKTIILNAMNELFCYYNPDLKILWGNKAAADSVGMNAEDLVGKHCYELWNQSDQPCDDCPVLKSYETGKPESVERKTPDGRYWRLYGYPIFDRDGSIKNLVELGLDITEKKKTEIALKENMEKYHTLFETMAQGVVYQNAEGKIISANPAAERILGLSLSQMQGRTSLDPRWKAVDKHKHELPGENHPSMIALKTGEKVTDFQQGVFNPKKNDYVWIIVNAVPQFKDGSETPYQVYSTFLDVTDRVNAEQNMEESEKKFKKLFENSQNGIVLCQLFKDEQGNPIDYIHLKVNPATEKHLGYKPETLINKTATDLIGEKAGRLYAEKNGNCVITGEPYSWVDFTPVYNKYLRMDSYHIKDDYFAITFVDISKEKLAVKKIEESEKKFRQTFEQSTVGYSLTRPDGELMEINQAFASMLGYKVEELSHKNFVDITHPEDIAESKECIRCLLSGEQQTYTLEKRYVHKNGDIVWALISTVLLKDTENKPVYFITSIQDITQRKKAEVRLKETLDATTDGIWTWDFKTDTLFFSDRYYQMLGYQPQEFKATFENWINLIHPDDRDHALAVAQEYLKKKPDVYENDFRLKTKQGEYRWIQAKARVVQRDENGVALRLIGNHEDITNQKKAEIELLKAKQRLEDAEKTARIGNVEWYVKEEKGYWSDVIFELYERDPSLGVPSFDEIMSFHHPDDAKKLEEAVSQAITKGIPYGVDLRTNLPSGKESIYHAIGIPRRDETGEVSSIKGTVQDVTEVKRTEIELRNNERKFRTIVEHANDGIALLDITGVIIDLNQRAMDIFGGMKDKIIGQRFSQISIISENDVSMVKAQFNRILQGKGKPGDFWLTNKKGERLCIEGTGSVFENETGEKRIVVIVRDITEKKNAEQALQAKEKRFRNLAELLPAAVVETDADMQITFANNHAFKLMNYTKKDYEQGVNALEMFPPDEHERVKKNLSKRMAGKHLGAVEYQALNRNGEQFPVLVHADPLMKDGVFQGLRAVIVDITKIKEYRKRLESLNNQLEQRVAERTQRINQLLQQKDEFINQLGHDLKNPLGPLTQLLPLVEKHVDDPKYKDMLQVAIRNTRYMKQLVTKTIQLAQLKSPNTELNYESINLSEEVSEIIETNQLMLKENQIKVQNNLPESLTVHADKLKMHEVVNNLLNNAVKYTDEKPGFITIDSNIKDDDVIVISIKDSGIGMTSEQLDRVFDEFYKADSSRHDFDSSGLGMPICKRIVEMHGGKIWAESEGLGKGSTFFFSLPTSQSSEEWK